MRNGYLGTTGSQGNKNFSRKKKGPLECPDAEVNTITSRNKEVQLARKVNGEERNTDRVTTAKDVNLVLCLLHKEHCLKNYIVKPKYTLKQNSI